MATTTAAPQPASPAAAPLRAIDIDLHHQIVDWSAIAPFAPAGLRHRFTRRGGPPMASHGFKPHGAGFGPAPKPTPESGPSHPAADPAWVKTHYLAAHGVDRAILTGTLTSLGVQPNADMASAIAGAVNDWTLATWLEPFDCFKGSILVAPQDPIAAVAEIDRLGDRPSMVQVLLGSASETPLGRRQYHPIYAACVAHGLPLALHIGGEGAGMSPPPTAVGQPSTFTEWYTTIPQNYMAHIMSMITEGVFEKFPSLKVILYEAGIFWVPHLMWRFDKNWKAQRSETPWVKQAPHHYILRHFHYSTYPLEAPPEPTYLHQILTMIEAEHTLLFSSAYPNWAFGDPFAMLADLPPALQRRVMVDNALAVYGDRLLTANR
jgi:predicted TIM-barrel fold metal-dependent hydrolase